MVRPLTAVEQAKTRRIWSRIDAGLVVVTDEATSRYNCLAWTLGITTSRVWPWGGRPVDQADFDAFYLGHGFSPAAAGMIAAYGLTATAMTHGGISGPDHGPRWGSKAGACLRIRHGLDEIAGGVVYGDVVGFYQPSQTGVGIPAMTLTLTIGADRLQYVRTRAARVDRRLKERFDRSSAAWKEACDDPLVAFGSDPAARAGGAEFDHLIAPGREILPLLLEKLTNPGEFFALVAVDRLLRPELLVTQELGDETVLLGEQWRAAETVRRWVRDEG